MKKIILLAIFSWQCNSVKNNRIEFIHPLIEPIFSGFINSVNDSDNLNNFITIHIRTFQDSTIFAIADSYPDINIAIPYSYTIIRGQKIFFVGGSNNNLVKIEEQTLSKEDLRLESKKYNEHNPDFIEPKVWMFYFKKDTLKKVEPKDEIVKYIKLSMRL